MSKNQHQLQQNGMLPNGGNDPDDVLDDDTTPLNQDYGGR